MDCEKFSSLQRLLRVTAYVFRFVDMLKHKVKKLDKAPSQELTAADILEAETLWVKESQHLLMKDKRFDSWQKEFGLFAGEDGLYRCKGRLSNADLPPPTRHPILLPKEHHLTTLIVENAHKMVMHNGIKETLTELRARYWLVKGRQFVRQLLHKCVTCRKFEGTHYHHHLYQNSKSNPNHPSHTRE